MLRFFDYSQSLWPCTGIRAFQDLYSCSSIYRLASAGKPLYLSAYAEILGSSLVVSMGGCVARVPGCPRVGMGQKPGMVIVSLALGPARTLNSQVPFWSLCSWASIRRLRSQEPPRSSGESQCWGELRIGLYSGLWVSMAMESAGTGVSYELGANRYAWGLEELAEAGVASQEPEVYSSVWGPRNLHGLL